MKVTLYSKEKARKAGKWTQIEGESESRINPVERCR